MNRSESIIDNKMLNRKIVYAVKKAITQDIPQDMRENRLETNNRQIFAANDFINDNLRNHVVKDDVDLISFKRHAWEGRILVDRENRVTYTISTHNNLKTVIEKNRKNPHYLMSLLYVENGDCEGFMQQISLGDIIPGFNTDAFEADVLEDDFDKIMKGIIRGTDGYKHYIVAYTREKHEIVRIELLLLDKKFITVDKLDLMEYVTPDYADIIENSYDESEDLEEDGQVEKTSLLKLKHGVKPQIRAVEKEA